MAIQESKSLSRRKFLKGAGEGVAGITVSGVLSSCAPKPAAQTPDSTAEPAKQATTASWKVPPAPIPDSKISSTVDADVVVVGGGIAGMSAALSAADAGAKVALLEKWTIGRFGGAYFGVADSKMMRDQGRVLKKTDILINYLKENQNTVDARLISAWINNSGEAMDWMLEKTDAAGLTTIIVDNDGSTKKPENYNPAVNLFDEGVFPAHRLAWNKDKPAEDSNGPLLAALTDIAKKNGINLNFSTPAQQLVKNADGRVTGVIATDKDGKYIKFNAAKAVILCTGDYASDADMVNEYVPWGATWAAKNGYTVKMNPAPKIPLNTGDGHKMAIWAGAAMQEYGHALMITGSGALTGPFTMVNSDGQRFMNENTTCAAAVAAETLIQKDNVAWQVFDSKYAEDIDRIGIVAFNGLQHGADYPIEMVEKMTIKADTLEALADLMKVPKDHFVATIQRRNELVKNGEDVDYGVVPERLVTVEKAPFYASKIGINLWLLFSGLIANEKLQALTADHNVIPGLYLAGNTVGKRFCNYYFSPISGGSNGLALTHGYLAGKYAAAEGK
jgi:fumarate reductase flavoprotein subunit